MLAGKYLNGFPDQRDLMFIPPGWDEWYSALKGNPYGEFNYALNENGKLVAYGNKPEDYGTDVYARKTIDFIQRTSQEGKPFFIYLAVYAPHSPATPAPRHADLLPDAKAPRPPSFNEDDIGDKPAYIRSRPKLTNKQIATIDADYRKRLQSLQAVDEMIGNLVDALKAAGQLDNTYLFFTSDNGFHLGHHRLPEGKQSPYEEDIRVPLIVRGPGVPVDRSVEHMTGNIDLAPTWAELAGVKTPDFVDGRSLVSLLRSNPPPSDAWRQAFLIQHGAPKTTASLTHRDLQGSVPTVEEEYLGLLEPPDAPGDELDVQLPERGITPFQGIRTKDYTYVEYTTGERELYALRGDPYQLQNMAATAKPDLLKELSARLAQVRRCAGASCRTAEDAPFAIR
jgi:arylsulfatase A-like enzyme